MSLIKFNNSVENINVILSFDLHSRTIIKFDNINMIPNDDVLLSGFIELNEHNGIMQSDYSKYRYIYKKDDDKSTYTFTIISDDVYVEPETISEYISTEKEVAEQETQQKISDINSEIRYLQNKLNETDYIFVKSYEASLIGETINEYDFSAIHTERQLLREQINKLESELISI